MILIKCLKSKSNNIWKWSRIWCRTICKSLFGWCRVFIYVKYFYWSFRFKAISPNMTEQYRRTPVRWTPERDLKTRSLPFPCNGLRCVPFRTIFVDWTSLEILVNIILYIKKTKILTVTWFNFFFGCIFSSDSCLFAIAIAFWPVAPCSTVSLL